MDKNKWMFFDLGGTLIDEKKQEKYIVDIIVSEFRKYGETYSETDVFHAMKLASINYKSVVKEAVLMLSKSQKQYNDIIEKAVYLHELEMLFPDVIETLEQLSKRFKLGIIANQSLGAEERMKNHKIHKYFSVFALSGELGFSKPDKRIFEYALNEADCLPKNAYMVGDRLDNDIYPAKKIGMSTIRIMQGVAKYQEPFNQEYEPNYVFNSVGDIINFA